MPIFSDFLRLRQFFISNHTVKRFGNFWQTRTQVYTPRLTSFTLIRPLYRQPMFPSQQHYRTYRSRSIYFGQINRSSSSRVGSLLFLVAAFLFLEEWRTRKANAETISESETNSTDTILEEALFLMSQSRFVEGLLLLEKLIVKFPLLDQAIKFLNTGDLEQAIILLDQFFINYPSLNSFYLSTKGALFFTVKKDYEQALSWFEKAVLCDPKNYIALTRGGNAAMLLRNYEKAIAYYTEVLALTPHNAYFSVIYEQRGLAYSEIQKYPEALSDFTNAIHLNPHNATYYAKRGVTFLSMKRYEEAVIDFQKSLELEPENKSSYMGMGEAQTELNQYQEALITFERGIKLFPEEAFFYKNTGDVLCYLQRYEDALPFYNKSIQLNPHETSYYRNRGFLLYQMQRYDEALESCDEGIQRNPNDAQLYFIIANAHLALKHHEEALCNYNKAIQLNPHEAYFYINRSSSLYDMNRYEEANQDIQKAVEFNSQDPYKLYAIGVNFYKLGKTEEAVKTFNNIIHGNSADKKILAASYKFNSLILDLLGRYEEALPLFEKQIAYKFYENDEELIKLYEGQGFAYRKTNQFAKALEAYNQAIELDKKCETKNYELYTNRAYLLQLLNLPKEALKDYEDALAIQPNQPLILYNLGLLFMKLGYYSNAYDHFAKVLQIKPDLIEDEIGEYLILDQAGFSGNKIILKTMKESLKNQIGREQKQAMDENIKNLIKALEKVSKLEWKVHKIVKGEYQDTKLHQLVEQKNEIQELPEFEKHLNQINKEGLTPLMIAVKNDDLENVKYLLEKNAEISVVGFEENLESKSLLFKTAISVAQEKLQKTLHENSKNSDQINLQLEILALLLKEREKISVETIENIVKICSEKVTLHFDNQSKDNAILGYYLAKLIGPYIDLQLKALKNYNIHEMRLDAEVADKYRAHLEDKSGIVIAPTGVVQLDLWDTNHFFLLRMQFFLKTLVDIEKNSKEIKKHFPKDFTTKQIKKVLMREFQLAHEIYSFYQNAYRVTFFLEQNGLKEDQKEKLLNALLDNSIWKINSRQTVIIPSGSPEHALYLNFSAGNLRIDNVGLYSHEHKKNKNLIYPCFISGFYSKKTDDDETKLRIYLKNNYKAKFGYSRKLSNDEIKKLIYPNNPCGIPILKVATEPQYIDNCVVKNQNIGYRIRTDKLYSALIRLEKIFATTLQEDAIKIPPLEPPEGYEKTLVFNLINGQLLITQPEKLAFMWMMRKFPEEQTLDSKKSFPTFIVPLLYSNHRGTFFNTSSSDEEEDGEKTLLEEQASIPEEKNFQN